MSNYTQLGFVKQTDGENTGTWGDVLNENLIDLLDDSIGGYVEVSVASGNVTLAFADGTADNNGRHAVIKFTGSPGTTRTVTFPDKQINYFIVNGSDSSVICTSGSGAATVTIPTGLKDIIYVDGSDEIYSMLGSPHLTSSGNFTVDATTDIILDADGGDIFFKDAGTTFGSATNTSGNLIIKSGTTTALTFSGANVTAAGNLTVDGNLDVTGTLDLSDSNFTNVGSLQLDSIAGDGDTNTSITFSGSDVITVATGGAGRLTIGDGALSPVTNNQIDLGTASLEFKDAFFDGTVTADAFAGPLTGNVTGNTSGTAATVTGAAQSNITSLGTLTTLTVDNVIINGSTIGHTGDTDLMTVASGVLTVAGEVDATSLDISGDADIDGTLEADAITIGGVTLAETISDTVGAMVTSNTESGITVAYQDADNTLDFTIGTLNQDTTGTAAISTAVTVADESSDTTCFPLFATAATGDLPPKSGSNLTFNSSSGLLTATSLAGTISTATQNSITTATGLVTTGALNSGSITSGFGTIDTGSSTITTTGLISGGSLDIDNVLINGTTIGHTDDTDLITVADGLVTVAGEVQMTTLDIGGTNVTATAAELNYSDLATLGTTAASKVFTADANNLTTVSGAVLNSEATLSDGANIAWNVIDSPVAKVVLGGNRNLSAPSGSTPAAGQFVSILIIQDGTGSRTVTFNAVYEFAADAAPTLTTTANLGDLFVFRYNGAKWLEVGRNLALTLS